MAYALTAEVSVFLDLLTSNGLAVMIKNTDGRYVYANEVFAAMVGRSADALPGMCDGDLFESNEVSALKTADQAAWAQSGVLSTEQRLQLSGQRREFSISRAPWKRGESVLPEQMIFVWRELTATRRLASDLETALKQLEQQQQAVEVLRKENQEVAVGESSVDLYQRAQFDEQLRREVDLSSREHREFALVSILLDPLSDAVRVHGDVAHTRVLEALSRLLRSNTRAMDASCRLDQDRFAVLLSGVGLATAHARMEGLRRQCATQIVALNGQALGFTVSMGVASFPHTAHSEEELLKAADMALQEAQRRGGNHVTLASIRFDSV